jgi:ACS family hexuronate transporter-like MFS transporter
MINYMDRLTLNAAATTIIEELNLDEADYSKLEAAFGFAFALGSLGTGFLVDRWNVRWMYPAVVLGWSLAGLATGFSRGFGDLLLCRFALGLFEGGNWTCALRTTQRILRPDERSMGNSILQSGAAVGATITPLIVFALVSNTAGTWRHPFFVIGAAGCAWIFLWLPSVSSADLALPHLQPQTSDSGPRQSPWSVYFQPRFLVLIVIVVVINLTWHFFRTWLPLYLEYEHGYSKGQTRLFGSAYYGAADVGSLSSGFAALLLARGGMSVHHSRVTVFAFCAAFCSLSLVIAVLPTGPLLLVLLLVLAFAALGMFPQYYSFSQELTTRHQGKLTGVLGFTTWMAAGAMQWTVGQWIEKTKDYRTAITIAGLLPLLGLAALYFWRTPRTVESSGDILPATIDRASTAISQHPGEGLSGPPAAIRL